MVNYPRFVISKEMYVSMELGGFWQSPGLMLWPGATFLFELSLFWMKVLGLKDGSIDKSWHSGF